MKTTATETVVDVVVMKSQCGVCCGVWEWDFTSGTQPQVEHGIPSQGHALKIFSLPTLRHRERKRSAEAAAPQFHEHTVYYSGIFWVFGRSRC